MITYLIDVCVGMQKYVLKYTDPKRDANGLGGRLSTICYKCLKGIVLQKCKVTKVVKCIAMHLIENYLIYPIVYVAGI